MVLFLHRRNIVKRFAQLRMMSDIRYEVIIYFARANRELIFYVIKLNFRHKNTILKKRGWDEFCNI